jgi:hypothetical protein
MGAVMGAVMVGAAIAGAVDVGAVAGCASVGFGWVLSATTKVCDSAGGAADELTPVGAGQGDTILAPLSFVPAGFVATLAATAARAGCAALASSSIRARERSSAWASAIERRAATLSVFREAVFCEVVFCEVVFCEVVLAGAGADGSAVAVRATFSPSPFKYQQWRLVPRSMR